MRKNKKLACQLIFDGGNICCKVYDLWCDQHGLPHLSADEQDCHGMQAGQVEWLTRFRDAWSFYEHADGEARADLRETAAQ